MGRPVMNEWLPLIAAIPAVLGLLAVGARVLLSSGAGPVSAWVETTIPSYESALDWALHFSMGAMVVGIGTALTVELASSPSPAIGLFTGFAGACVAFVMVRPPPRLDADRPELDGRSFGLSSLGHCLLGVGLASLLAAG